MSKSNKKTRVYWNPYLKIQLVPDQKIPLLIIIFLHFSQHCERNVANTTHASKMFAGHDQRHGFLISMANSRQRLGKRATLADFTAAYYQESD